MKHFYKSIFAVTAAVLFISPFASAQAVGDFDGSLSIGTDNGLGEVIYDETNDTYEILASGHDIWGGADGFYWVYKEITGNFSATVDIEWGLQEIPGGPVTAGSEWKKAGLMVRDSADADNAPFVLSILRNDYNSRLDLRTAASATAKNDGGNIYNANNDTNAIQLVRFGNTFTMLRGQQDGSFIEINSIELELPETLFLGLVVTAHDSSALERAFFSNFNLTEVSTAGSVSRTINNSAANFAPVEAGTAFSGIELSASIEEGKTADATVIETLPVGWVPTNVSASAGTATVDGNIITWAIPGATGSSTLTYDTVAGSTGGLNSFLGSINTGSNEFSTGGVSSIFVVDSFNALGVFDHSHDVGVPGAVGGASYENGTYTVTGSGHDIWNRSDDFHFVYREVTGNVKLVATVVVDAGESSSDWVKAGLMIRDSLSSDSGNGFASIRIDGQDYIPQWRARTGNDASSGGSPTIEGSEKSGVQLGKIEIERDGDDIVFFYYDPNNDNQVFAFINDIPMVDPIYVGLGVTSHETGSLSTGTFTDVSLFVDGTEVTPPVPVSEWALF